MTFHKSVNKFVLTIDNRGELMKCSPKLNVEAVADSGDEQIFRTFRQIVEVINVFGLEERNGDFNCIGIVSLNLLRNNLAGNC